MTARLVSIAFDAVDPVDLATFWARALGWQIRDGDEVGVELVLTDVTIFSILF
jgi:hypothetical protein